LALESSTNGRSRSPRLARRTRFAVVTAGGSASTESAFDGEGDSDAFGPWSAGPGPAPAGLGAGGGVSLPFAPDEGTAVSSNAGSSPSRDFGGVSTVELRVVPLPGREGTATDEAGEPESEDSGPDGMEVVAAGPGPSDVTVVPDPQFVHGVDAGVV